jgi:hypothetical protein
MRWAVPLVQVHPNVRAMFAMAVVISIGDVSAPNFGPDLCLQGTWWPFIRIIYLTRDRLEKLKKIGGG